MKRLHELQDVNSDIERLWPEPDAHRAEQVPSAMTTANADQEAARLQASLDEYDATLKKANKRIERLMGEKSQLKSLLDKRDHEIQQVNRELGGYASGRKPARALNGAGSPDSRSPYALFATIGERIRGMFVTSPEAAEDSAITRQKSVSGKSSASQPLIVRQQDRSEQQIVIAVMLGLDRDEVERLLPIVEQDCASKSMTPLFLIDIDAFEVLRSRNLIFEYFPPDDDRDRFDASLHWDLYVQRRLALIRKKWDPIRVVAFGKMAMRTLTLWCSSPFEDAPLPAISSETTASSRDLHVEGA